MDGNRYTKPVSIDTLANKRKQFGKTELHIAAKSGQLKTAKLLLEQGVEVNVPDEHGWQPLHKACNRGHAVVASLLIEHGADINNNENDEHITPLHYAASQGHMYVVKLLIDNGASLNIISANGETVLESLQELIRLEEAWIGEPSGFLEARKQVEAFILSLLETEVNEQITTSNKENTNVEPYLEKNDVIIIIDSPSKIEKDSDVSTNNVELRPEKKISTSIDSQSFSNDTPFQYDIDACVEKLVNESSLKGKTIAKESLLKVNTSKENNHYSEGLANADFIEMYHNSTISTSKNSKIVSLRNEKISDNNNNNINDKSDTIISCLNDTAVHKADHIEAVTLSDNSDRSTHNAGENGERSTHNASENSERSAHNAGYISTNIDCNDRPTNSKFNTISSANLQKNKEDKTETNGYSMFSNDITNNSLIKSDDEVVSNKLNHRTISNTDSVLQINIHEHDQFLLIPFHNKNEMSTAGWLIDKNKTCIELVRRKVGSPLSPLRPEHNKVIQLNKEFDIFEQKQSCTNDENGPLKSNLQQGETSTVPNLSPPRKRLKLQYQK